MCRPELTAALAAAPPAEGESLEDLADRLGASTEDARCALEQLAGLRPGGPGGVSQSRRLDLLRLLAA